MYLGYMGLGEDKPSALQQALSTVLSPVTGALKEEAIAIAKPAGKQMAEAMQPMIREELERQVPTFAIYAGLAAGGLVLVGIITGLLTRKGA